MVTSLPYDLESEILSRVPATSLRNLRYTCKRWYALSKDSRFIKKNLGLAKAATQVILKKNNKVYLVNVNPHGFHDPFDPSIEYSCLLKGLKGSEHVMISEIFQCGGLMLCTTKDNKLVVWNPCTGQTRWIKSKPFRRGYTMHQNYFLGYENNFCVIYKILSFGCYYNDHSLLVSKFEMYEFSSDSWMVLDDLNHVGNPIRGITCSSVSLKGNTYWCSFDDKVDPWLNFILKFDFTRKRFVRLSLPFQSDHDGELLVLSVVGEEKLALLRMYGESEIKIWVSNTVTDEATDLSWNDFLVLDFSKLMICMTEMMSFLVDGENKRVACCDTLEDGDGEDKTVIYIFGEDNMHKQVYRDFTKGSRDCSPQLVSYVPRLVHIQTKHSHNHGGKRKR